MNISRYFGEAFETFRIFYIETQCLDIKGFIGRRVNFVVKRSLKSRRALSSCIRIHVPATLLIVIPCFTHPREK